MKQSNRIFGVDSFTFLGISHSLVQSYIESVLVKLEKKGFDQQNEINFNAMLVIWNKFTIKYSIPYVELKKLIASFVLLAVNLVEEKDKLRTECLNILFSIESLIYCIRD